MKRTASTQRNATGSHFVFAGFFSAAVFVSCLGGEYAASAADTAGDTSVAAAANFETQVAPLLARRCLECHSGAQPKGGLDLTTRAGLLRGGESGPAVEPRRPQHSLLLQRVRDGEMPPPLKGDSRKLPSAEVERLQNWIAAGAVWPDGRTLDLYDVTTDVRAGRDWWSLQPVREVTPPRIREPWRAANAVDAFILAKLDEHNMQPAPPADQRTLVRRAYFGLLGLPPTEDDVAAFVRDERPDAWSRLIDRLLNSPHYGERWGRHWLDVVRFAETCGYERDQLKPGIWKYRDWVIEAFNSDLPYDRFIVEQLAGDELPDRSERTVIATGMIRAGTWNDEPNDPADYVYERLQDMIHTTASAFLGLTVKCARCHDHKFDPIPQRDYYRFAAAFWAGYIGQANLGGPNAEQLGFDVFGWTDRGREIEPLRLLIKGERTRPGPIVEAGVLSAIPALDRPFSPPAPQAKTTQRRLQLARWIADPANPLAPRVIVNRLWMHHFGEGLVRTPNNFGFKGDPPTHPDLLDWLAGEFLRSGFSIKHMHRVLMTSAVYRQASVHPRRAEYSAADFGNRLCWRANRRRLEAEALRDALLSASGLLNEAMGGPSFFPQLSPEALEGLSRKGGAWGSSPASERRRRSVYLMTKRSLLMPLMTTFDFCDTTQPCGQRDVTTVAPQALALLNNHFVHEQSEAVARRVERLAGDGLNRRVEWAWRLTLGRRPTQKELVVSVRHVEQQAEHFRKRKSEIPDVDPGRAALASLCHVLLNTNEFAYVD